MPFTHQSQCYKILRASLCGAESPSRDPHVMKSAPLPLCDFSLSLRSADEQIYYLYKGYMEFLWVLQRAELWIFQISTYSMKPKLETIYFLGKMVEVLQSVNFVLLKLSSHQVQVYSLFKLTTHRDAAASQALIYTHTVSWLCIYCSWWALFLLVLTRTWVQNLVSPHGNKNP